MPTLRTATYTIVVRRYNTPNTPRFHNKLVLFYLDDTNELVCFDDLEAHTYASRAFYSQRTKLTRLDDVDATRFYDAYTDQSTRPHGDTPTAVAYKRAIRLIPCSVATTMPSPRKTMRTT